MFPPNGEGSPRYVHARPERRMAFPNLSPAELFRHEMGQEEPNAKGADSWPPWTDAPVEFLDYDAFDDQGNLLEEEAS